MTHNELLAFYVYLAIWVATMAFALWAFLPRR